MGTTTIDDIEHNRRRYDEAKTNPAEKHRPYDDAR
jgi:hypothetical protein